MMIEELIGDEDNTDSIISNLWWKQVLSTLDDEERRVVSLLMQGYYQTEIGKMMGIGTNKVAKIKQRAFQKIAEEHNRE